MVHTETKIIKSHNGSMRWVFNVPFELVDRNFTNMLKDKEFTYDEYLAWSAFMNKASNVWNLVLLGEKETLGFAYGTWNPLEKELEIKRVSLHPRLHTIKGTVLKEALEKIKEFSSELGVKHVYWITPSWRAFFRKLSSFAKILNLRVLEVIING